jgi:hypothetical protein
MAETHARKGNRSFFVIKIEVTASFDESFREYFWSPAQGSGQVESYEVSKLFIFALQFRFAQA